jgi:hypothetical protein
MKNFNSESSSVPKYFLWLKYLSWLSYANDAMTVTQWKDVENIKCMEDSPRCFTTGANVLDYLNIRNVKSLPKKRNKSITCY